MEHSELGDGKMRGVENIIVLYMFVLIQRKKSDWIFNLMNKKSCRLLEFCFYLWWTYWQLFEYVSLCLGN